MAADNETAPSGSGHCTTTSGSTSTGSNVLPPTTVSTPPSKDVSNSLVYYKRGDKKNTARSVLKDVTKYNDFRALNEIANELLDPRKDFSSAEIISWINHLIAGGRSPDEYSTIVKSFDQATSCGLVWTANFVAYRCRTCGISPCMSLCAECFQKGKHEGHDYNMFRSQAGGACDCGDSSVMKSTGFCSSHQPDSQSNERPGPPEELTLIASLLVPKLLHRLLMTLRQNDLMSIRESDNFIVKVLTFLTEMGDSMRRIVSRNLIDETVYARVADYDPIGLELEISDLLLDRKICYKRAKKNLSTFTPPKSFHTECSLCPGDDMKTIKSFEIELKHETFVDELLFWTIKYEFPQKLVCFLLNMLPNYEYKTRFAKSFVNHYSRVSMMLAKFRHGDVSPSSRSTAHDQLSNCVVHVSVQLFSNEPLAEKLCREDHLLHVMITSLRTTIEGSQQFEDDWSDPSRPDGTSLQGILIKSTLQSNLSAFSCNHHYVVRCDHYIMRKHTYWPLVSDLNNILTHEPVSIIFLNDHSLVESWLQFMLNFQGMNLNQRELVEHVEYENESYYAAFSAELEICSTPIWTLVSHLKNSSTAHLTQKMITTTMKVLDKWFDLINFTSFDVPSPTQATFHIPLHRYYSIFLHHSVSKQGLNLDSLLPPSECKLKQYLSHPLQVIISFYEILCGLWARNGLQMKGQAMTYIQCHFCNSMIDPDLFLIQLIGCKLNADWFIQMIFERFHVLNWLSFSYSKDQPYSKRNPLTSNNTNFLESDQIMPMIEATLTFLATVLTTRTNLGMSEGDVTRKEMVTLLSMSDRTHSQLLDLLPEKCGTNANSSNHEEGNHGTENQSFETILKLIANYKKPTLESGGNLSQGMFHPKNEVWLNEFDPIHVLLRAVHRRDYQSSMDRFVNFVKSNSKTKTQINHLWPPFRLPTSETIDLDKFNDPTCLLQSKFLHGILFSILYKANHVTDNITDQVLALTIYLLELSFHTMKISESDTEHAKSSTIPVVLESTSPFCVSDLKFNEWFSSDSILINFNTIIQSVTSPESYTSGALINRVPSDTFGPSVEEMEVDLQSNQGDQEDEDDEEEENVEDNEEFMSADEDFEGDDNDSIQMSIEAGPSQQSLPSVIVPLALLPPPPSPSTGSQLSPSALALVPSQREIALMNQHHFHQAVSASPPVSFTVATTSIGRTSTLGPPALPGPSTSPIVGAGANESALMAIAMRNRNNRRRLAAGRAITAAPNVPSSSLRIPIPSTTKDREVTAARSAPASAGFDFQMDHDSQLGDLMKALPSSSSTTSLTHSSTFVNESILSLLLRLHSKLSKKKDSYRYIAPSSESTESRIGDGLHFIGNLLDTYVKMSPVNGLKAINEWRERIWPPEYNEPCSSQRSCSSLGTMTTDDSNNSNNSDTNQMTELEMKKKRAKERQQRLMAEFASKQKAFMKKYQQQNESAASESESRKTGTIDGYAQSTPSETKCDDTSFEVTEEESSIKVEEFECVICNQTTASKPEKLIGMIVLLQSTSVLGHCIPINDIKNGSFSDPKRLRENVTNNALTCNEDEERNLRQIHEKESLGKLMRMKFETFERTFGNLSWLDSVNIGWEGGIHVASCGHYLHLDCHKSYTNSLKNTSTMNSSMRQGHEAGEFNCPLCRQLANSVLPIVPDSIGLVSKHPIIDKGEKKMTDHDGICNEILSLFHEFSLSQNGQLIKLLGSFMEDLTKATSPQYRSLPTAVNPTTQSLFLFLCSIIRTNVEIDVINKLITKNTPTGTKKPSFKSLFNVLVLNAKVFITTPYSFVWTSLTGSMTDDDGMSLQVSGEKDVPFLLKDPSAILIQFLFSLPLNLEITYYSQVTSMLLNLVIIQSLVTISCFIGEESRKSFKKVYLDSRSKSVTDVTSSLPLLLGFIIQQLDSMSLYLNLLEDDKMKPSSGWDEVEVSNSVMAMALPFLRNAAILQSHLYDTDLPDVDLSLIDTQSEFGSLRKFLGINHNPFSTANCNSIVSCLWWPRNQSSKVIKLWCQELTNFSSKSIFLAQDMLKKPILIQRPSLLKLPPTYDQLFLFYHQRRCLKCRKIPKEPCVCLVCGTLVCMRDACCRQSAQCQGGSSANSSSSSLEAVSHSTTCGTSTGIFLAINSSTIIVIRGKRACVWGSLYLDSFGEEDRDLKRGKPLYLSKERYQVLEQQWLTHSFDHTNKRWVWHKDTL